ncbi:hypothetical protein evm_000986 [Chilo suppressalis]|nr:hypothetical protein evm_000986 [Chilo suppressalis]
MSNEDTTTVPEILPCYEDLNEELQMTQQRSLASNDNIPSSINGQVLSFIESKIEIELQIADLRWQQLMLDRQHAEEVFKAKEIALDAEIRLAVTKLNASPPSSTLCFENNRKMFYNAAEERANNLFENASAPPANESAPVSSTMSMQNMALQPLVSSDPDFSGISQLSSLNKVTIHPVTAPSLNETYKILDPDGSEIYRVEVCVGHDLKRALQGKIINKELKEVATFHTTESRTMELLVGNKKVFVVKRQPALFKLVLTISTTHGKVIMKIKGQGYGSNKSIYTVETATKENIGCIIKNLNTNSQPSNGSFDYLNSVINFHRDLKVVLKAAIVACSFLIVSTEHAAIRGKLLKEDRSGGRNE